jgi:hypothetical protein
LIGIYIGIDGWEGVVLGVAMMVLVTPMIVIGTRMMVITMRINPSVDVVDVEEVNNEDGDYEA